MLEAWYSNYLKFLKSKIWSNISGLSNKKLLDEYGILILVKSCNIDYLKPALFEDQIK